MPFVAVFPRRDKSTLKRKVQATTVFSPVAAGAKLFIQRSSRSSCRITPRPRRKQQPHESQQQRNPSQKPNAQGSVGVSDTLAATILAALPQTQCTRCGYPDCRAYAEAIAHAGAPINQCPPGGAQGIVRLASITGRAVEVLNPHNGTESPRGVAVIDENWCIGCTLCIDACPTDAILGSNKAMHTIIERYCTGCELCLPVCPVDCISMANVTGDATGWAAWSQPQADEARDRYEFRSERLMRDRSEKHKQVEIDLSSASNDIGARSRITDPAQLEKKRAVVDAALARARARKLP
jgi:Na+-translocating ferredoxin:NAD+ oxidoreductase subunit B